MRQALALVISIVLGLMAVFAMKNYINREKNTTEKTEEMVKILFVKRHLSAGTKLMLADIQPKDFPLSSVTPDMVKIHEKIEIEGKVIRREINRGGPLFHSDFLSERRKIVSSIAKGRRLVSLPVNQISGVSGLIKPGNRVDILLTLTSTEKTQKNLTKTILLLQNVSIYATDSQTSTISERFGLKKKRSYSTLTLSVTPTEAALLTNAVSLGSISFLLRSNDDFGRTSSDLSINVTNIEQKAREANELRWQVIKEAK
jgi:pilus assembly protein CpaB